MTKTRLIKNPKKIDVYLHTLATVCLFTVIFVILWGAFVRVTHSGAGCGAHWPLCDGEVLVLKPDKEKAIEYTHRVTSGLSFLLVLGTYLLIRRNSIDPLQRLSAFYSFVFITTEALIGAGLVLFGWVKDDSSTSRAFVIALHLVNSFLLLFFLSVLWLSTKKVRDVIPLVNFYEQVKQHLGLILLFILVGSFGAITALGDTLFPSKSLIEGLNADLNETSHFLIKLRVLHPLLALWLALKLVYFFMDAKIQRISIAGISLVVIQIIIGCLNVILLAPTYLQILHLLISIFIWVLLSSTLVKKASR